MRPGLPRGCRATSRLWLPFRDIGSLLADLGPDELTVTSSGSVAWAEGPHGDGCYIPGSGYLTMTMASFAGAITGDMWVSTTASSLTSACRILAADGGSNNVLHFEVSETSCKLTAYNAAGTSYALTPTVDWLASDTARWTHFRFVVAPGTALSIYRDGALIAYTTSAPATLASSALPPFRVGGGAGALTVADVHLLAEADTDPDTTSPMLGRRRATRRQTRTVEIDLRQFAETETWTADGSGGYWLALSDLAAGGLVLDPHDIVTVKETDAAVTVAYTSVGNVIDLDAASDSYFLDLVNSRIYVSEDPATVDDLAIEIRLRIADHGYERGGRFYRGLLTSEQAGSMECPWWGEIQPTGGGATMTIARHSSLPANLIHPQASAISWISAPIRVARVTDSMPWSERVREFWGVVDTTPDDNHDKFTFRTVHEPGRLYRVPVNTTKLHRDDWPNMIVSDSGRVLSTGLGAGLQRAPLVCVDPVGRTATIYTDFYPSGVAATLWKYKWSHHPWARLVQLGGGNAAWEFPHAFNIDLTNCTLELYFVQQGGAEFWVSGDGLGDPSSPTSPADTDVDTWPFGDVSDCYTSAGDQLWWLLETFLGYTSANKGTTWAATAARVGRELRFLEELGQPGDVVELIRRILRGTITFLWWDAATEKVEWEDSVAADSAQYTLRDTDVLSEVWESRRDKIAARMTGATLSFTASLTTGTLHNEHASLDLSGEARERTIEVFDIGQSGCPNKATLLDLMGDARNIGAESALHFDRVSALRVAGIKQFDKVQIETSRLPSGAGTGFRVLSVAPGPIGTSLLLAPEAPLPADGTSTTSARDPRHPFILAQQQGSAALTATAGAWTPIGNSMIAWQGSYNTFPAGLVHGIQAYAVRVGGAADADLQTRLAVVNSAGTTLSVIATFTGIPTAAAFLTRLTSLSNLPTTDALLQWQYQAAAGVSGTVTAQSWFARETAGIIGPNTLPPITVEWETGYRTGADCTAAGTGGSVPNFAYGSVARNFVQDAGTERWLLYAAPNGATAFHVYGHFMRADTASQAYTRFLDFGEITAEGWYEGALIGGVSWITLGTFFLAYTCSAGTGKAYAASLVRQNRPSL